MRSIIRKELRENIAVTVLGLLIFSLMLGQEYRSYENLIKSLALGANQPRAEVLPLASGMFVSFTGFFCGLFAALLGWLQGYRERHRDLWSFLVHRPVSRTRIFWAKVAAGLGLYAVAAGMPLLVFIYWAASPGHVAAPFEWILLKPALLFFLAGIGSYLAGMLTCLRQARWYASRGLPLGMALVGTAAGVAMPGFGRGLFIVLLADAFLLLATWGALQTNGFYKGEPRAGRMALPVVLMFGVIPVIMLGLALFNLMFPRLSSGDTSWSAYQMTKDGRICKMVWSNMRPTTLVDLEGNPLTDLKAGKPVPPNHYGQFSVRMANNTYLWTGRVSPLTPNIDVSRLMNLFKFSDKILWYYSQRYGRLLAYDVFTRRFTGSLGPDGFVANQRGGSERFDYSRGQPPQYSETLHSATGVFRIDLERRSSAPIFRTDPSHPILASADLISLDNEQQFSGNPDERTFVTVVTPNHIRFITITGKPVWETSFEPGDEGQTEIRVWALQTPTDFALWITPCRPPNQSEPNPGAIYVTWFNDGRSTRTMELPDLQKRHSKLPLETKLIGLTMPPAVLALAPVFLFENWPGGYWEEWIMVILGLIASVVICAPLGWWLSRRYSFKLSSTLGWVLFLLCTGLPGLLAFLSVQEWPAREECPQCGRKRIVEREHCEHCGGPFPPPAKLGIEIFD